METPEKPEPERATIAATARITGVPERTIRRWIDDGDIAAEKLSNGRRMISLDDVRQKQQGLSPSGSEATTRLQQIVSLAVAESEERGRLLERAKAEQERRESVEATLATQVAMMRDLLSRAGITLQSTG